MSTNSIIVSLSLPSGSADPYFIHLDQEKPPDEVATVGAAADLLDALFGIEPCTQEETPKPEEEEQPAEVEADPFVPEEIAITTFDDLLRFSTCLYDPDFNVDVKLRVIRSDLDVPYKLTLQGGRAVETIQVRGEVTRTFDMAEVVTLDYPLLGGLTTNIQPLTVTGNTLTFPTDMISGRSLVATFETQYDLVTVRILGVDDAPGTCTALVFFHGLAEELELETPDIDPAAFTYCRSGGRLTNPEHRVTCFDTVVVSQYCSCSKDQVGEYTYERQVDCPSNIVNCPNNMTECSYNMGTVTQEEYVVCTNDSTNYHSLAFYREVCCGDNPKKALPNCRKEVKSYTGGKKIERGEEFYRSLYGKHTKFVPVTPPLGVCGEWTVTQELGGCNNCEEVLPIVWDSAHSADIIANGSSGTVMITDGKPPFIWSLAGTGFLFEDGRTVRTTTAREISVHAGTDACGTGHLTVTDGCTTATGRVRSGTGKWNDKCVILEAYSSGSPIGDRYRLTRVCGEGCSIAYDDPLTWSPPPSGSNVIGSGMVLVASGSTWASAAGYCLLSGVAVMDRASFEAAVAAVSQNITVFTDRALAPPPSELFNCAAQGACEWIC
jgi:hypothetical protein